MKLQLAVLSILATLPLALAQPGEPAGRERDVFYMQLPGPGPVEHTFDFVSSQFSFEGRVVKNAPYSAEGVTETTQRLPDGNRIARKTSSNLYRDSEGRTRREEKLGAIGPWSSNSEPSQTVFINDPVSNTNLVLDSRHKTARKMPSPKIMMAQHGPAAMDKVMAEMSATFERRVVTGGGHGDHGEQGVFISSSTSTMMPPGKDMEKNTQRESLGSQVIEGIRADGTRTTMTIPAGAIGNDLPIQVVSERWYSPELQTVVMTKHSDPRMGETIYRLTNVSRTEPARSLFEAPADYTVTESKPTIVKSKD